MDKNKAIPDGYMLIGQVAKKMGVSNRTLQYYDKVGLLTPSAESEGGRRLYTGKDVVRLHQILSLKSLGFSLDEIKNRLISLDTPAAVADVLTEQASAIRKNIAAMTESLEAVEMLKTEVLQMQTVDFKKYADIIVNLQMKNEFYWLVRHFDDTTLDYFRSRFDMESSTKMIETVNRLQKQAIQLQQNGVRPESEKGQAFAKAFWDMVMDFTGGDMEMVSKLMVTATVDSPDKTWKQRQAEANVFIEPALSAYFEKMGYESIGEAGK